MLCNYERIGTLHAKMGFKDTSNKQSDESIAVFQAVPLTRMNTGWTQP